MIILFSEEKRRKANMNIEKKNNPIKKKPLKTKRGPGEDETMDNPVINKLEDINCNIQRYMDQVIENGHEALEKYSDKLRNIINTLGVENLLSKNQIMTFLAHVRDNYHPVFEKEAETDLFDYYFEIKIAYYDQDTLFPVNNRTFEALIKMCQARAKLDCMAVVRSDHVREVKDMFKEIVYLRLSEVAVESAIKRGGQAQVDRNDVSGLSVPKQKKIFIDVLNDEASSRNEKYFSMAELREIARSMKLKVGEFYSFIEELNHLCILIKGKDNCYELRGYYH